MLQLLEIPMQNSSGDKLTFLGWHEWESKSEIILALLWFSSEVLPNSSHVIHCHYVISRSWFDKINSWWSVRRTEMNINGAPVKSQTVQMMLKTRLKYGINACFSLLKAPHYSTQIWCFRLPQLFLSFQWAHASCTSWYHQFRTATAGPEGAVELVTASNWYLCINSQLVKRQDR